MTARTPAVTTSEHHVDAAAAPVRVRTYHPRQPTGVGIVWIHGGAFFMNDIDVPEVDWVARRLAEAGIAVVTPDYRLASDDVHFPALTDDCAAVWSWASSGSAPLAVQPAIWHLGGGSAGANLAASVAMQVRDGRVQASAPRSTVLVYPAMHSPIPQPSPELAAKLRDLPADELYTAEDVERINLRYVGERRLLQHPYAFPGHGELAGMPPALIVNSEHDPLRASGQRFGSELVAAGVDAVVIRERDAHHGHLNFPEQAAARRTVDRMVAWLGGSALVGVTLESDLPARAPRTAPPRNAP